MKVDKYVLQRVNKRNVIECIVADGPINKSAIAEKVGLSIPSVMHIVDEFERDGLVRSAGKGKSRGGKRPDMIELVRDAHFVAGVDVGRSRLKAVLTDLSGEILGRATLPTGDTLPPEQLINRIADMTQDLIERSSIDKKRLLGIGVGMPGLIDAADGHVFFSPDFDWENIQLRVKMQERFKYRIMVENSNLSMARGEHRYGSGQKAAFLLCVSIGHGIGAGILENGKPYRGCSGTSGEIGHMTVDRDGPMCACGNTGCLEAMASGESIARQALDLMHRGVRTAMTEMVKGNPDAVDAKLVFEAAAQGDGPATAIVDRSTKYIGTALASCINLLDPDRVVLGGGMTKAGAPFIDRIKEQVQKRQMKLAGRNVRICVGTLGDDATAMGATCQVLESFFESGGEAEAPNWRED